MGEVLIVVDTDMPVPRIVSRLRIDFYTTDHVWYGSRDISRARVSDWPTSFGVYLPDNAQDREVIVRLRAYPQGEVRDYRGERYAPRPTGEAPFALTPVPPPTDQPRLVSDESIESTPSTEPTPLVTIDRLVRLRVRPNVRAAARIVLRGECVGTMADIEGEMTCVETENERVAVTDEGLDPDLSFPAKSQVSSFDFAQPCTAPPRPAGHSASGAPLHDEEVCVDGAMFIFGSDDGFGFGENSTAAKRIAILPPFRLDRYEVTVSRWRDALARGLVARDDSPFVNDTPIPRDGTVSADPRSCTFSAEPMGREDYPLTCVSRANARAFCQWTGGDLPTEAQWEYVTMEAGRAFEAPFPWGGAQGIALTCDQALFGRGALPINNECNKDGAHYGVTSVLERAGPGGDVSLGLGVVGLAGSVQEMVLDSFASLRSNCWNETSLRSPTCRAPSSEYTIRGGSWSSPGTSVFGARRASYSTVGLSAELGFRCARAGD